MGTLVRVAKTTDLAPGQGKTVEANGREIALFNVGGTFYAIDNTCKHRGGSLGEGELDGTVVTCPLHAWTYDVSSGECFDDPACAIDRFAVQFGVYVVRDERTATLTHNLRTTVIGPDGRLRKTFDGSDWTPGDLLASLRQP